MAAADGLDLRFTIASGQRAALEDCDAVLTSFRPGEFESRVHDERIPLRHGVIGQETQGPGGFFMALRVINVMKSILADMEAVCPKAWLVNYTNPINLVSQAVTQHSPIRIVSLCEGPFMYPEQLIRHAGLDPHQLDQVSVGINHAVWSIRHLYQGRDVIPLLRDVLADGRTRDTATLSGQQAERALRLAVAAGALPSFYFQYYYFHDEMLAELARKPTTRAEDILAEVPGYWAHYREQARAAKPVLDPARSRGGIFELELAIEVISAIFNDRGAVCTVNALNHGALAQFPDDLVVEVPACIDRRGVHPIAQPTKLAAHQLTLVSALAHYQVAAAEVAWSGTWRDGVRALASNPLVRSLAKADAIYRELAAAHAAHLPMRLLPS
jgi:6-phospho-beta-glucosidase